MNGWALRAGEAAVGALAATGAAAAGAVNVHEALLIAATVVATLLGRPAVARLLSLVGFLDRDHAETIRAKTERETAHIEAAQRIADYWESKYKAKSESYHAQSQRLQELLARAEQAEAALDDARTKVREVDPLIKAMKRIAGEDDDGPPEPRGGKA